MKLRMGNVLYELIHWNPWSPGVGPALRGYGTLRRWSLDGRLGHWGLP